MVFGQGLVVADAATVFGDPAEGSFHDPTAGQDQESGDLVGAFDPSWLRLVRLGSGADGVEGAADVVG